MALALGVTAKQVSFISLNRDSNRCLNSLLRLPYNFLWNLGRGFHNTFNLTAIRRAQIVQL